jgi:hypothetical protein
MDWTRHLRVDTTGPVLLAGMHASDVRDHDGSDDDRPRDEPAHAPPAPAAPRRTVSAPQR